MCACGMLMWRPAQFIGRMPYVHTRHRVLCGLGQCVCVMSGSSSGLPLSSSIIMWKKFFLIGSHSRPRLEFGSKSAADSCQRIGSSIFIRYIGYHMEWARDAAHAVALTRSQCIGSEYWIYWTERNGLATLFVAYSGWKLSKTGLATSYM